MRSAAWICDTEHEAATRGLPKKLKRVTEKHNVNLGRTVAEHTGMCELAPCSNERGAAGPGACDSGDGLLQGARTQHQSCAQTGVLHTTTAPPPGASHRGQSPATPLKQAGYQMDRASRKRERRITVLSSFVLS